MNQTTSIFHYSKNYGSLTRVTRLKVAVNIRSHMSFGGLRSSYHKKYMDIGLSYFDIILYRTAEPHLQYVQD